MACRYDVFVLIMMALVQQLSQTKASEAKIVELSPFPSPSPSPSGKYVKPPGEPEAVPPFEPPVLSPSGESRTFLINVYIISDGCGFFFTVKQPNIPVTID